MKAVIVSAVAAVTLLIAADVSARTVLVPTPVGLIAVHNPRPAVRPAVVVVRRPACVRHFRHRHCR